MLGELMGGGASVNKTSKMQIIFARLEFHAPLIIGEIKKGLKMQWKEDYRSREIYCWC